MNTKKSSEERNKESREVRETGSTIHRLPCEKNERVSLVSMR